MVDTLLVIRFGSLGDVILTSATVLNLKLNFPTHRLVYLTKACFRSVVETFDGVDEVLTVSSHASASELTEVVRRLDDQNVDLIVDLHGNLRSWLVRRLVTANVRTVYPKRRWDRWRVSRRRKHWPAQTFHTIDLYNSTLADLAKPVYAHRPVMRCEAGFGEAESFFAESRPTVVVAPGAAHPNKQWPPERFAEVAELLHDSLGAGIIWATESTDPLTGALKQRLPANALLELAGLPLDSLGSIVARADLALGNDTGVGHLASAVGTPVLALFGPTHPVLGFSPRGLLDRVLGVDEPCRPCSRHGRAPCYREEQFCFTRLAIDQVIGAASDLLTQAAARAPALLLDRDGTIMENKHYLADPDQVVLFDGVAAALRRAQQAGYRLVIVSNQSGIGRGYMSAIDVERVNERLGQMLRAEGVEIDRFYFCPHSPAVGCGCRKPAPGMAEQAALDLGLNLRRSVVIGDSMADINIGRVIGARSLLVRTGHGLSTEQQLAAGGSAGRVKIFASLAEAVGYWLGTSVS